MCMHIHTSYWGNITIILILLYNKIMLVVILWVCMLFRYIQNKSFSICSKNETKRLEHKQKLIEQKFEKIFNKIKKRFYGVFLKKKVCYVSRTIIHLLVVKHAYTFFPFVRIFSSSLTSQPLVELWKLRECFDNFSRLKSFPSWRI